MEGKFVTFVHLFQDRENQKLGIRLVDLSVDDVERGGGRAIFELYRIGDQDGEQPYLTIVLEARKFRASQGGAIPDPDKAAILAEATELLRGNLLDLIETLGEMRR